MARTHLSFFVLQALLLTLVGCQDPSGGGGEGGQAGNCTDGGDNDEDGDIDCLDEDCLTDHDACPVMASWLTGLTGQSLYTMNYTSGALEGTECTVAYSFTGTNITELQTDECVQCDAVYSLYTVQNEGSECTGRDDDPSDSQTGFDLRQSAGEAVLWLFVDDGGWGSDDEWSEFAEGDLERSDTNRTLTVHIEFDDPDNGSQWGGNATSDEPCGSWSDRCSWDGSYSTDYVLSFDPAAP